MQIYLVGNGLRSKGYRWWGASKGLWSCLCHWNLSSAGTDPLWNIWNWIWGFLQSLLQTSDKFEPALGVRTISHLEYMLIHVTAHCRYKDICPCLVAQLCYSDYCSELQRKKLQCFSFDGWVHFFLFFFLFTNQTEGCIWSPGVNYLRGKGRFISKADGS